MIFRKIYSSSLCLDPSFPKFLSETIVFGAQKQPQALCYATLKYSSRYIYKRISRQQTDSQYLK